MAQRLAVVIGINYESLSPTLPPPEEADRRGLNPLRFAEADAQAMANLLRDQGFDVLPLLGADATRRSIVSAISRRNKAARAKDDLLVIYFAGHGEVDEDERAYLLPVDFDPDEPDATALRLDNLARDYLDLANASLTLL